MEKTKHQKLLELYDRKGALEKGMDSFDIATQLEKSIMGILQEIFYPYDVLKVTLTGMKAPDGVVRFGSNLVFYECLSGTLDVFQSQKVMALLDHITREEIFSKLYPGQLYSFLVICKDFSEESVAQLKEQFQGMLKRPRGLVIITPEVLIKLHELSVRYLGIKETALLSLLETIGPLRAEYVENKFLSLLERPAPEIPPTGPLRAVVEYGDTRVEFQGSFEDVWRGINKFLSEIHPPKVESPLSRLIYRLDLEDIANRLSGILQIDPRTKAPVILVAYDSLRVREKLALHLLATLLSWYLGFTSKDSLQLSELSEKSGVKYEVTNARITEMVNENLIERLEVEGRREYRITPNGINATINAIRKRPIS